jgi:hypothetical protein
MENLFVTAMNFCDVDHTKIWCDEFLHSQRHNAYAILAQEEASRPAGDS